MMSVLKAILLKGIVEGEYRFNNSMKITQICSNSNKRCKYLAKKILMCFFSVKNMMQIIFLEY
jgi:hypothetical protein